MIKRHGSGLGGRQDQQQPPLIPREHVYSERRGESDSMRGMRWFGCCCGASGSVSDDPEAQWRKHVEAYYRVEEDYLLEHVSSRLDLAKRMLDTEVESRADNRSRLNLLADEVIRWKHIQSDIMGSFTPARGFGRNRNAAGLSKDG